MGLGPIEEDDELQPKARIARPNLNDSMPAMTLRGINAPGSTEDLESKGVASHIGARPIAQPSPIEAKTTTDQNELSRLQSTGSGISQIKNPIARGAARGLNVAGSILGAVDPFARRIMPNIPGTEEHHNRLIGQQQGKIGEDLGEQKEQGAIGETAARTEQATAAADRDRAEAAAKRNPPPKEGLTPEETTIHDLMTGENGQPRMNPQTQKPYSYLEAYQSVKQAGQDVKPDKVTSPEQQFIDSETAKGVPLADAIAHYARLHQPPQQPERPPHQLVIGPDGKVIELKPGMSVPQGSQLPSAELGKPSADEQRRADLANNMNENMDQLEDIVKRRPDLFGPVAGRYTSLKSAIGTGDPDIAKLNAIHEYLGMASVGAHSMRNAQHVGAAADAVMAGFHNSPEAMLEAIKTARSSTQTFYQDVQRSRGVSAPPNAPGGNGAQSGPAAGTVENGYRFKGGDASKQENWEKVAQ